ncbi:hypothetical protein DH2020_009896 [Rehmannia glutinosa]|uniref:Uncharacterized protein n=1 Tax=Rehmannia glutinosa TaxID=99300 RepID=A0ABR0X7L4_REHGL
MTEELKHRSLEEPSDLERTEDEFSNQLNGAADGTVEHKRIPGNSSLIGPLPSTRWNTGFPGERWDSHLLMPSKESRSQGNCISETSDVVSQQLPQESGDDAVILGQKIPKSGPFQLRKSGNPYRPPHCNKKMPQPLDTFSEPGVESSGNSSFSAVEKSDQRGSADSITGNDEPGYEFPLSIVDDSIKIPLHECEASWKNSEPSEMIGANDKLELGIIKDNQPTFDDFWAEILDILQHQQEAELGPTSTHDFNPDSEVEICLPDEDSLISVDHSTLPKTLNFNTSGDNDDEADSEAEIILPDEDSLITIYDMIVPNSSMPTLNRDFLEADKVTSNTAVSNSCKVQPFLNFPRSKTHGKLHSQLSHSQTSNDIFGPEKPSVHPGNDHMNFLTKSYAIPYAPTLNGFTCSNFHHRSCLENITNTNTNDSLVQYSLLQQPSFFPKQQNHLMVDTQCSHSIKQVARPDYLNAMQFPRLTSQQKTYQGFGKSNAGQQH